MKSEHSKRIKAMVAATLAITTIAAVSAVAASTRRTKTIDVVYDNIQIVVDGVSVNPKDADGNIVEPFIYNGTTYLPVRAVGNAIGKDVNWDGINKVVYLGAVPGQGENWMSQCKPYKFVDYGKTYLLENNEYFVMSGKKYTDGFELHYYNPEALFNLDGKYNRLSFTVGHIDDSYAHNCTLEIWLDGKISFTKELRYDDVAKKVSIPLNGALQMKIKLTDNRNGTHWGFSEGKFE